MQTIDQIRGFITGAFARDAGSEKLTDDQSLIESGVIDSLGIVKVLTFIERQFNFKVPEQDVVPDHFDSVRTIADYVNQKLSDKAK